MSALILWRSSLRQLEALERSLSTETILYVWWHNKGFLENAWKGSQQLDELLSFRLGSEPQHLAETYHGHITEVLDTSFHYVQKAFEVIKMFLQDLFKANLFTSSSQALRSCLGGRWLDRWLHI